MKAVRRFSVGLVLAVLLASVFARQAMAWDIWLVTSKNRILVVRDVETSPHQEYVVTHQQVPDAATYGFGDIGFAPNGKLYAASLSWGQKSHLYTVDLSNGHITQLTPQLPFEWGNALEFDLHGNRGFIGGGMESYSPYVLSKGLYSFTNYDPGTTYLWHDMRGDYPSGGFGGDYAEMDGSLYAVWGTGNWSNHHTYLLKIATDANGNFVSYVNLGEAETHGMPEGIWGLGSDGDHLYAISPTSLYKVTVANGVAAYAKVLDFDLQPGEKVNGASAKIADLSIALSSNGEPEGVGDPVDITVSVTNAGPYDSDETGAKITLPGSVDLLNFSTDTGSYDPASGEWNLGTVSVGKKGTLTLTVRPNEAGDFTVLAEINHASATDPDSVAATGFGADDWHDGRPDDDEASLTLDPPTPTPIPTATPVPPTPTPAPTMTPTPSLDPPTPTPDPPAGDPTVVPEPSTFLLIAAGVFFMLGIARERRKKGLFGG